MRSSFLKSAATALSIVVALTVATPAAYAAVQRTSKSQKQKDVFRDVDPIGKLIRTIKRLISQDQPVIPIPNAPTP
jgi:hypothetical protein